MKKLLSLLSTITMASSGIPGILSNVSTKIEKILKNNTENNFLQTNNLKRNKRQTPPWLKNIITTINIGKIKKVNINSVIKRLSEINHPILSRQDFLENIEFEKITTNLAIVHFRNWEFAPFPRTLTFTINFDSDIVNLNGNLGIINENAILNLNNILNNRPETIARQFIERNDLDHLLTVDDLIVTNITTGSALIESSNINYLLSVNVIFMPRYLSLRTFITNTNLGHLETNSKDNIIKRLHEINNLNYRGRNIRLEVRNITRNSAEILFNQSTNSSSSLHDFHSTGNFDYEYTITITFTITKIDLSTVIVNTDLGTINDSSIETIIKAILNINPNSGLTNNDLRNLISDEIKLIYSTDINSFRFGINPGINFSGHQVFLHFSLPYLSSVIENTNLKAISDNRPETIIEEILRRNPNSGLTVNDLVVTRVTTNSATITSQNNNYFGTIDVVFDSLTVHLSSVITNTDLGDIPNNSFQTIITEVIRANPNSGLTVNDLVVTRVTTNSATITSQNNNYFGTIDVVFDSLTVHLSSVITNTDLGDIPNNSFQTIITEVIRANPNSGLTVNDLVVTRVTTNSATITSQNNNYFGNINVTFNNIKKIKSNQIYKLHDNDDDDDNNLNNSIEKRYRFLQPDQLKIIFKKEIWEKEIKPHIETIINIVSDINKFPISDYSLFEKYNEQDRNMTIGGVVYNYKTVDDYFKLDNTKYVTIDKQLGGGLKAFLSTDFYYSYFFDYILINNAQNNSIEKWYKFLQPDQLKISFNKEIWEKEIKPHIETIINIVSDINKFPISDYSLFEKYNEQDRNTLISFLICHFIEINDYFQSSNSLIFSTDTFGITFDIEKNKIKNYEL
ncbi:hypothetical protein [Spiroplasma endosymbiont of Calodromius spilotus]|uniref:hypothetical protein n=1 Tax=Spiroplasma endosymbiont of Calodromius spilotus TaxID=3077929 RepID=UPI0031FE89ED